jgi:hypothetical protein
MNHDIVPMIVVGSLVYGVFKLVQLITEYKLKRRLMDKAQVDEGFSAALADSLKTLSRPRERESNPYPSLKWGLVTLGLGIALIITDFMEFDYRQSVLPFGLLLTGASAGFLIYYLIVIFTDKKS